jgi:HEPN domain-containing protein
MKPLDAERFRLVEDWIAKAELDFVTVVRLLEESTFREIVAFHSQQAVEKYPKSLLNFHQIEFSKTHVIRRLLFLLEPQAPELARELSDANWLTPFGSEIRYPGSNPGPCPAMSTQLMNSLFS